MAYRVKSRKTENIEGLYSQYTGDNKTEQIHTA